MRRFLLVGLVAMPGAALAQDMAAMCDGMTENLSDAAIAVETARDDLDRLSATLAYLYSLADGVIDPEFFSGLDGRTSAIDASNAAATDAIEAAREMVLAYCS